MVGSIVFNCIDEDSNKTIHSEIVNTESFRLTSSLSQLEEILFGYESDGISSSYNSAYVEYMGGWEELFSDENCIPKLASFKAMASSLKYNPTTKTLESQVSNATFASDISKMVRIRQEAFRTLNANSTVRPFLGIKNVAIPSGDTVEALKDYQFDFGIGEDTYTKMNMAVAPLMADATSVDMLLMQSCTTGTLNLYYKATGETKYKVIVTQNGVEVPELTREYPANVGDVIEDNDVDTSVVPGDWNIVDITAPITVKSDEAENIIYVKCESDELKYTIMYYLDGVYKEKESIPANMGAVITKPTIKGYYGYTLDYIDGTPLTIKDSNGVIRVYYKKNVAATGVNSNAILYKDEYRTAITKSKSGYGVYGLFFVDVSNYVNSTENPKWTVNGGCSPTSRDKTVNKYKDITVTATATYAEGLPLSNKNGRNVTVTLVKDTARSTATVWAYRFPSNSGSSANYPKAYIPINYSDGRNWTINFKATISFNEYQWSTGSTNTSCSGHSHSGTRTGPDGKPETYTWYSSHNYTVHPLKENRVAGRATTTGSASIMVKGSMYEDDFTGSKN